MIPDMTKCESCGQSGPTHVVKVKGLLFRVCTGCTAKEAA